jgi:hypothetical protein
LSERNVLNVDAIRAYAEAAAEAAADEGVRAWARSVLPRFIIKHYHHADRVERRRDDGAVVLRDPNAPKDTEPRPYAGDVPDWCRKALDDGKEVLFVRLDGPLHKRVRRTLGHLDAHPSLATSRISFMQAEKWAKQARRNRRDERIKVIEAEGTPVFRFGDATVVQLTSATALEAEGHRMWNCLAKYSDVVREGRTEIYSVRDRAGHSRAVIEVDRDGYVLQIKGYENRDVPPAWRKPVRAFITARGYGVANDIWNLSSAAAATLEEAWNREGDEALISALGRARLRALRYVGIDAAGAADAMQLVLLLEWGLREHAPHVRRVIFDALAPEGDAAFRERPLGLQRVYDVEVTTTAIEIPLPFLNLARIGYFKPLKAEHRLAKRLLARAQAALATLAFRDPQHLFFLGPNTWSKGYMPHWASAADALLSGAVEVRTARSAKHRALRERLNRANRRLRGVRSEPTGAHLALRWLLDGGTGQYVV